MKKLTTLLLAAGLVVSSFAGAQAGEFKPNLQFVEEFSYGDAGSKDVKENFAAVSRIRMGFDYIQSEDLSATLLFQYGAYNWGGNKTEKGQFNADPDDALKVRLAYIDWTIPSTDIKVRMGRQAMVAPSYAFGSPILDSRGDGISFNAPINDNINVGLTWARADRADNKMEVYERAGTDVADLLMLNAEFAYDGFKVAPWAMYINKQNNAGNEFMDTPANTFGRNANADAFVIGASAELNMFDPFVFALDALYNNIKFHDIPAAQEDSFDGFYVAAKASYKFSNGTAGFGGWYSSGMDEADKNDTGFVVLDGGFSASHILFDGNVIGADGFTNVYNDGADSPFGTWGLIAEYADFSFLENLSHTARILYVQGTNDKDSGINRSDILGEGFTEDDSAIEIDFNTTYQIYKNFSATLQLGYVFFDQSKISSEDEQDDIFRSALAFVYKF